ncbi:2-aminoethylphosphonate ABC transport system ATP-binding subunit PhnT, partial [Streptomyces anulatus]
MSAPAPAVPGAPTPGRTAPAAPSGIRFEGVTVAYGGNVVLDRLDLTVEPGEVIGHHGPSGSGNTTPRRPLAGIVRPATAPVF